MVTIDKRLVIVLLFSFILSFNFYQSGLKYIKEIPKGSNGYISDEVWYVSASRNILREVFHLQPLCSKCNATLVFKNTSAMTDFVLRISRYRLKFLGSYTKFPGIYVSASRERLLNLTTIKNVTLVQLGWMYPDKEGIYKYLNLEHPPIGKYFILTSIYFNDKPPSWRLPGLTLASVALFITTIAIYLVSRSLILTFASGILLYYDIPYRVMSLVAMLDIYASVFSLIAFSLLINRRRRLGTIIWGIAAASKYTAVPYILPLAYLYWKERKAIIPSFLIPAMVFVVILTLSSLPLIIGLGPIRWINELLGGIKWFLTSRPAGPPPASPLDWILGKQPSPLLINPDMYVRTNPSVMQLGIISFFLLYPLRKERKYLVGWIASLFLVSSLLGFMFVYLAGNKTLYTFYAPVFSVFADIATAGVVLLLTSLEDLGESISWWWSAVKKAWRVGWGEEIIYCRVVPKDERNEEKRITRHSRESGSPNTEEGSYKESPD